jgi:acetyl-CoA synthetase
MVMYEGLPNYPDASRIWQIIDRHQVNILYTAPTAIRALMREGDDFVKKTSRKSLRVLGTVGEPINPEAWEWYYRIVGNEQCPIVDTWWQTETGGITISPLAGCTPLKPGSATNPFFGVRVGIADHEGNLREGEAVGNLVTRMATTGLPAALTTSSMSPATGWAPRKWKAHWLHTQMLLKQRWLASRTI